MPASERRWRCPPRKGRDRALLHPPQSAPTERPLGDPTDALEREAEIARTERDLFEDGWSDHLVVGILSHIPHATAKIVRGAPPGRDDTAVHRHGPRRGGELQRRDAQKG